jgi:hypothetical protein
LLLNVRKYQTDRGYKIAATLILWDWWDFPHCKKLECRKANLNYTFIAMDVS